MARYRTLLEVECEAEPAEREAAIGEVVDHLIGAAVDLANGGAYTIAEAVSVAASEEIEEV